MAEVHLRARIGDAPGPVQSLGQHCFRLVEFALKVIEHAEVVHRAQVRCIVAELQPALPRALEVDRCVGEQAHLGERDGQVIGNERHIVDVTLRLVYVQNAAQFRLRVLELAAPVERNAKLLLRLRKQRRGPIVREEQRFRLLQGLFRLLVLPFRAEAHAFDHQRLRLQRPLLTRFERRDRA